MEMQQYIKLILINKRIIPFCKSTFLFFSFFIIGMILVFYPVLLQNFAVTPGDFGDTRFVHFLLERLWRMINGQYFGSGFWNLPAFYPYTNTFAYSHLLLGAFPFYVIARLFTTTQEHAFQLWIVFVFFSNYLTSYILMRRSLKIQHLSSLLGSFIFTFSLNRSGQLLHHQLNIHVFIVLAALFMISFIKNPKKNIFLYTMAIMLAIQAYTEFYTFWFFSYLVGFFIITGLIFYKQAVIQLIRKQYAHITLSVLLMGIILTPLMIHYMKAGSVTGFVTREQLAPALPQWWSWIIPNRTSLWYGFRSVVYQFTAAIPLDAEVLYGPGVMLSILFMLAFMSMRKSVWRIVPFVIVLSVAMMTTIPFTSMNVWHVIYTFIPGANAINYPARYGMVLLLPASVFIALFFQRVKSKILIVFLFLILILDNFSFIDTFKHEFYAKRVAAIAHNIPHTCESFYLVFREGYDGNSVSIAHIDAMWAAIEKGIPSINGYSGKFPPSSLLYGNEKEKSDDQLIKKQVSEYATYHQLKNIPCIIKLSDVSD